MLHQLIVYSNNIGRLVDVAESLFFEKINRLNPIIASARTSKNELLRASASGSGMYIIYYVRQHESLKFKLNIIPYNLYHCLA